MYELWREQDARMAQEDIEREEAEQWADHDAYDAADEFYAHVESLPVDQAHMAIQGLIEYQEALRAERDILMGHGRFTTSD